MKFSNLRIPSAERVELEKTALETICACWYYDFADNINAMSDDEVLEIIRNDGVDCQNCNP